MTNWRKVFSLNGRGAPDPRKLHRILGLQTSTVAAWYAGHTSAGDLLNFGNSETRTLADAGSPVVSSSDLVGSGGNKLQAFVYDNVAKYHQLAHQGWMDFADTDHSVCIVARSTAANGELFFHCSPDVSGVRIRGLNDADYYKSGGSVQVVGPTAAATTDGLYHVIHLVRSGNTATLYVDGVAGSPVDVTDYGVDGSSALYIATGATTAFVGSVVYARINSAAMTSAQIAREVSLWQGIGVGGRTNPSAMTFARAGNAFQIYSDGSMELRAAGQPRVGDGILIEGAATNKFNSQRSIGTWWNFWETAADLNTKTGPDGTAYLDTILESVNNSDHTIYGSVTPTNGVACLMGTIIQPAGRDYAYLLYPKGGAGDRYAFFDLVNARPMGRGTSWSDSGCIRLKNGNVFIWGSFTGDGVGYNFQIGPSTDGVTSTYAGDATKGVAVGDMVFLEGYSFPTSIPDPATGTRVADDLSIAASSFLPAAMSAATHYNKLRIDLAFTFPAAIPDGFRPLLTITGNSLAANQLQMYLQSTAGGRIYASMVGSNGTTAPECFAVMTDANKRHEVSVVFDHADMSNNSLSLDGSNAGSSYSGNSGTMAWDLSALTLRIGSRYDAYYGNVQILDAKIFIGSD